MEIKMKQFGKVLVVVTMLSGGILHAESPGAASMPRCTKDISGGLQCVETASGVAVFVSRTALRPSAARVPDPILDGELELDEPGNDSVCIRKRCQLYVCTIFDDGWNIVIECDVNPRGNSQCANSCDNGSMGGFCPDFFSPPINEASNACHQQFPNDDVQGAECAVRALNSIATACQSAGAD